jgi:hypothetical protein
MDGMNWDNKIRSVLRDGSDGYVEIGPGLTDAEYGRHMGRLFEFLYDAVGEMRDNPQEPAHGYLRLAVDCAITELKEVNDYMERPNPHIGAWTRHIQQFDNRERVVDTITALAETVCPGDYNGAVAADMHTEMEASLREASVPISQILDGGEPGIPIVEYNPPRRRLFRPGEAGAA